jgi:hypothetical protein
VAATDAATSWAAVDSATAVEGKAEEASEGPGASGAEGMELGEGATAVGSSEATDLGLESGCVAAEREGVTEGAAEGMAGAALAAATARATAAASAVGRAAETAEWVAELAGGGVATTAVATAAAAREGAAALSNRKRN